MYVCMFIAVTIDGEMRGERQTRITAGERLSLRGGGQETMIPTGAAARTGFRRVGAARDRVRNVGPPLRARGRFVDSTDQLIGTGNS